MRITYLHRTYRQLVKTLSLSAALVAIGLGAAFAEEIQRFQSVNDWLYRGGRPSQEDVAELREMGIRTILNLEAGLFATETDAVKLERDWAAAAGMNFEHVPLGPLGAPRADRVDAALAVLLDPAKRPIFVHCKAGVDRTGFVVAAYRVKVEGWTLEQAYEEMVRLGFHSFLFWWIGAFFEYVGAPAEPAATAEANRRSVNRYDSTRNIGGRTYRSRGN
jgi:protein tyrosine/serine phosphatase